MDTLIEAIPTWALCYLFNSDATGLTEEEIALIDQWYTCLLYTSDAADD